MVWTAPTLRTTGDIISVSVWNADVVENIAHLGNTHDHNGDAGDGASVAIDVPVGMIAIFDTACPSGWTRVSAFDNKLIKASSSYGATGGATTHTHDQQQDEYTVGYWPAETAVAATGLLSYSALCYKSGGTVLQGVKYDSSGGWAVTLVSVTTTPSGLGGTSEPYPPYIDVVFCKKD